MTQLVIEDGTITQQAAYCGLSSKDVERLAQRHPDTCLVVKFRSFHADGRGIFTAAAVAHDQAFTTDNGDFSTDEIRLVYLAPSL